MEVLNVCQKSDKHWSHVTEQREQNSLWPVRDHLLKQWQSEGWNLTALHPKFPAPRRWRSGFGWSGKGKEQNKKSFTTNQNHLGSGKLANIFKRITYQVPGWYSGIRYSEMLVVHSFTVKSLKTAVTLHLQLPCISNWLLTGNHFQKWLLVWFLGV